MRPIFALDHAGILKNSTIVQCRAFWEAFWGETGRSWVRTQSFTCFIPIWSSLPKKRHPLFYPSPLYRFLEGTSLLNWCSNPNRRLKTRGLKPKMSDTTSITLEQPDVPSGLGTLLSTSWSKLKKFAGDQYRQHISEVLKCGPVPRHVAFIMDGNRRFARKLHAETKTGHTLGGQTLMDVRRPTSIEA